LKTLLPFLVESHEERLWATTTMNEEQPFILLADPNARDASANIRLRRNYRPDSDLT
jgi:hypothetical protein